MFQIDVAIALEPGVDQVVLMGSPVGEKLDSTGVIEESRAGQDGSAIYSGDGHLEGNGAIVRVSVA